MNLRLQELEDRILIIDKKTNERIDLSELVMLLLEPMQQITTVAYSRPTQPTEDNGVDQGAERRIYEKNMRESGDFDTTPPGCYGSH